jgi:hypothetical protein
VEEEAVFDVERFSVRSLEPVDGDPMVVGLGAKKARNVDCPELGPGMGFEEDVRPLGKGLVVLAGVGSRLVDFDMLAPWVSFLTHRKPLMEDRTSTTVFVSLAGEDDLIPTSSAHPSLVPVSEEIKQDEPSVDLNELE